MRNAPRSPQTRTRGFSLVEIIVMLAAIGIIASLAVGSYGKMLGKSKSGIATNLVETLNNATRNFSYANRDLKYPPVPGSGADELLVLRSLQWREPDAGPDTNDTFYAGPYMRPDWNPVASTDVTEWRIEWSGSFWKLLEPDTAGGGLKVDFDGNDLGTPYVFPDGYSPVGMN